MEQMLSIKRVPIKIEVKVTRPELKKIEDPNPAPSVKVSKGNNGVKLAAQPYKVDITAPRYDKYTPTPAVEAATNSLTLCYDGIAKFAGTDAAVGVQGDQEMTARNASRSIEAILSKLPKNKASKISYNEGTLSINYSMDNTDMAESLELLDFSSGFEFVPGSIEFVVSQMPDLEIEYLGDPLYFPRSADPNYKGEVDVLA